MKIPKRIAQTLMNSLKGGVVPRVGLPYVYSRHCSRRYSAWLNGVSEVSGGVSGGAAGDGSSVDADLSPERRLQGTRGQGLSTYKELIRNMSTKTKPEGGAHHLSTFAFVSSSPEMWD